ncbi:MAG: hypothetical protein DHS20C10_01950 [marine bacterium B5-7]|nr:MAG: hypothetical protein DHS20C10_01950 [marine bacterium B5-7]
MPKSKKTRYPRAADIVFSYMETLINEEGLNLANFFVPYVFPILDQNDPAHTLSEKKFGSILEAFLHLVLDNADCERFSVLISQIEKKRTDNNYLVYSIRILRLALDMARPSLECRSLDKHTLFMRILGLKSSSTKVTTYLFKKISDLEKNNRIALCWSNLTDKLSDNLQACFNALEEKSTNPATSAEKTLADLAAEMDGEDEEVDVVGDDDENNEQRMSVIPVDVKDAFPEKMIPLKQSVDVQPMQMVAMLLQQQQQQQQQEYAAMMCQQQYAAMLWQQQQYAAMMQQQQYAAMMQPWLQSQLPFMPFFQAPLSTAMTNIPAAPSSSTTDTEEGPAQKRRRLAFSADE